MAAPTRKDTVEQGRKPKPEHARQEPPRDTGDHGLHPDQHPGEPPHKHEPQGEHARPRDTGRHGA